MFMCDYFQVYGWVLKFNCFDFMKLKFNFYLQSSRFSKWIPNILLMSSTGENKIVYNAMISYTSNLKNKKINVSKAITAIENCTF